MLATPVDEATTADEVLFAAPVEVEAGTADEVLFTAPVDVGTGTAEDRVAFPP